MGFLTEALTTPEVWSQTLAQRSEIDVRNTSRVKFLCACACRSLDDVFKTAASALPHR